MCLALLVKFSVICPSDEVRQHACDTTRQSVALSIQRFFPPGSKLVVFGHHRNLSSPRLRFPCSPPSGGMESTRSFIHPRPPAQGGAKCEY